MKVHTEGRYPTAAMTPRRYRGKVCARHPALRGLRYKSTRDCVECSRESAKRRYDRDPVAERGRRYRSRWKNVPKVDVDAVLAAIARHNGLCDLCGTTVPGGRPGRGFHVDHCHTTGRVRGMLCQPCNMQLPLAERVPMEKLKAYLA